MKKFIYFSIFLSLLISCKTSQQKIFSDGFKLLQRGPLGSDVGAHTEYHYIAEARPRGKWEISTFRYNLPPSWYVRDINSKRIVIQDKINTDEHWHPILISGDEYWQDYTIKATFTPLSKEKQAGIIFRYQNDRQYYLFGIKKDTVFIKLVDHAIAFRKPFEKILAEKYFLVKDSSIIEVSIEVNDSNISSVINNELVMNTIDSRFHQGKIGLLADIPTIFNSINVYTSKSEIERIDKEKKDYNKQLERIRKNIPKPVVWKKIKTKGYGTSRNIRFGDMDGNGETDILLGQVIHHGHKDRNSELSCLTAINLNGDILWQVGRQDEWKTMVTDDVAFQIHDINNDGKAEVVYTMNQEIVIADAATGITIRKIPTPLSPGGKPTSQGHNIFPRILGDCLYFCDLTGQGFDGDFIIKDRYLHLWAYNNQLQMLWRNNCRTGHYPYAYDIDLDGKDEIMMGYTLFDNNGEKLWSLDDTLQDHADGVAVLPFKNNETPKILIAASDEGMIFTDLKGNILKHHYIGHVQNPAVANFRDDLPGLETVSVNFWGNQGIIHLFDSDGNIYYTFEPNQYGSMCFPLNWTGKNEEYFVLNVNVDKGGAFDGWGRKILEFPDDGHPDMCYANLDLTGDCRDEIVVWDPHEIWIYTQDNNPKEEKLFNPTRNALYNISNYQTTVSYSY